MKALKRNNAGTKLQQYQKVLILLVILFTVSALTNPTFAQTVDPTGGVFRNFKSKVMPILNSLVGIICFIGIFSGVAKMMQGDDQGKKTIGFAVIGGLIWTAANYIVTALG